MMTLKRLLKWAVKHELYISIYRDGSAIVESGDVEYHRVLAQGNSLCSALKAAKQELEMK